MQSKFAYETFNANEIEINGKHIVSTSCVDTKIVNKTAKL